jgi:Flp pilus assembly protein TadD
MKYPFSLAIVLWLLSGLVLAQVPGPGNAQHVVQVGAFADPEKAARQLKILQQKGFPILTRSTINAAGGTLTAVLAGPYANRGASLSAKEALEAAGWPGYVRTVPVPMEKATYVTQEPGPQSKIQTLPEASPQAESAVAPATAIISRRQTDRAARSASRGLAAMRANDLRTAEHLFREAVAADSGDSVFWSYLYSVLVRASKPAAAERTLQRGLISAEEPTTLAKLYARMLLDRGEKDAAASILQTHRPLPASDIEYDAFLAALLQQLGQYTEAGDIYRKLLTVEPSTGSLWIGLAISHESVGDRPDALSAFQRALRAESLKEPLARHARQRIAELQSHD